MTEKLRQSKPEEEACKLAKKGFQKEIRERLQLREGYSPHYRIREKLTRWHLAGLPRLMAERFERQLRRLGQQVPPRVVAAVFSTGWNRW